MIRELTRCEFGYDVSIVREVRAPLTTARVKYGDRQVAFVASNPGEGNHDDCKPKRIERGAARARRLYGTSDVDGM